VTDSNVNVDDRRRANNGGRDLNLVLRSSLLSPPSCSLLERQQLNVRGLQMVARRCLVWHIQLCSDALMNWSGQSVVYGSPELPGNQ
jgi:hypothetical protein